MRSNLMWRGSVGTLSLDGPILRREQFESLRDVSALLGKAETVYQEQVRASEDALKAARAEGLASGMMAGRARAFQDGLQLLGNAATQGRRLSVQLADIVGDALDHLLDAEIRQTIGRQAVLDSVEMARSARRARLLVHPNQTAEVQKLLDQTFDRDWHDWLTLEADPAAQAGDVVLQSDGAIIDARLATRLSHWKEAVLELIDQRVQQSVAGLADAGPADAGFADE